MTDAPSRAPFKIFRTESFGRDFRTLSKEIQARAEKAIERLARSPAHPALRTKKMKGVEDIWEASVTMSYRMTYHFAGGIIILRRIGTHDILKREMG